MEHSLLTEVLTSVFIAGSSAWTALQTKKVLDKRKNGNGDTSLIVQKRVDMHDLKSAMTGVVLTTDKHRMAIIKGFDRIEEKLDTLISIELKRDN